MEKIFEDIRDAVINGEQEDVVSLIKGALAQNIPLGEILNKGLIAGMDVVAVQFRNAEMYVPDVMISARAMQAGSDLLKPLIASEGEITSKGKIVIGTVKGDLHDIGKKLVAMMLEGAGFEVIDLGTDVSSEKFVEAFKEINPDIIGMSALLTTTMPAMKEVMDALAEHGYDKKVKVMVGGAVVTADFAKDIKAYYADDAGSAAELAKTLV